MKKFISTLTSLCMSVSLTAGTLAAFSTSAAVSDVPIDKTLKLLVDGKSNYTVSAEDIAKGDVTIEVGVYIDEKEATTGSVTAKMGVSSAPDESAIKLTMNDLYSETVDEFEHTFVGGVNDGKTVKSKKRLAFYGKYKAALKAYENSGSISAKNTFDDNTVNFLYTIDNVKPEDLKWTGAKSDDFPVNVFTVTLKKGAKAGDYKIDFVNDELSQTITQNGEDKVVKRSTTQVGYADLTIKTQLDNLLLGGLGEEGLTITVEGDAETTESTAATTAATTDSKPVETTTTAKGEDIDMPEGLVWKVSDVKLTREELIENDGYVFVPVVVAQTSDQMIAGAAMSFKFPDKLTWMGGEADTENAAYNNVKDVINEEEPLVQFVSRIPNPVAGGRDIGFTCKEEGAQIVNLCFQVPTDIADGKYDIDMYLDEANNDTIVADNKEPEPTHLELGKDIHFLDGSITIGEDKPEPSTEATTAATTKATTAASTKATTAKTTKATTAKTDSTTGKVLYGDANDNGTVSIADVVCLNQYLVDNDKYKLTAQGKINAEVNLDGKITAADSTSIIKSLVKLVTLPDVDKN